MVRLVKQYVVPKNPIYTLKVWSDLDVKCVNIRFVDSLNSALIGDF